MNGIYKIKLNHLNEVSPRWRSTARERDKAKPWHLLIAICESLSKDGLDYNVSFKLSADAPYVLITASGVSRRTRKPISTRASNAAMTADQCTKRLSEIERFTSGRMCNYGREATKYSEFTQIADQGLDFIEAELEFWREMETLSGQRQHNKPGMTDENIYADDEVMAA